MFLTQVIDINRQVNEIKSCLRNRKEDEVNFLLINYEHKNCKTRLFNK